MNFGHNHEAEARAINIAAKAMGALTLEGMTMARWNALSALDQHLLEDRSLLTTQLKGLEGSRVEVIDRYCNRRRFWVGRSTGWRPVHLEIPRKGCRGGHAADSDYQSVLLIKQGPNYSLARR